MIKGFLFEQFKGYDKAVLWLEQVTTLIGTNASGKSNAIEGIQILSELSVGRELNVIFEGTNNIESAIRGGAKGCCRFGAKSFKLGCLVLYNETYDILYRISIGVTNRITIDAEDLYLVKKGKTDANHGKPIFKAEAQADSGDIVVEYSNGKRGANPQLRAIRSMSVLSQMQGKLPTEIENYEETLRIIRLVQEDLSKIYIMDPIPAMMHHYSRIGDSDLRRNCSNISSVLFALSQKKDESWKEFENLVKTLPENEIKEIDFVTTSLNDVILIEKEETETSFAKIDAARLSDGTLRCIAALAAVMSIPEGGLVIVEEVDNGIHPSRAQKLMSTLATIARKRGVELIVTTHNVTVLNGLDKNDILGVSVAYRDAETKASRIVPFVDIQNQEMILATGGIGQALETDSILRSIKKKETFVPFRF